MEFAFGAGGGGGSTFAASGHPSAGEPATGAHHHHTSSSSSSLASSISSSSHHQLHHDLHYQHRDHNHHHQDHHNHQHHHLQQHHTSAAAALAASLTHDDGPMIFSEPNRTSAIDDIRSVVIYIFIVTIFFCFFLILPGIRSEKFPTFLCITTSLLVTSIILLSLFGTTWHVADAPISAAYKAFSRDRIQGELSVKIGLQSVNITLRAHKYYILHATDGPIIMENSPPAPMTLMATKITSTSSSSSSSNNPINLSLNQAANNGDLDNLANSASASSFINQKPPIEAIGRETSNLGDELLGGRTADGIAVDPELEADEVFAGKDQSSSSGRWTRSSSPKTAEASSKEATRQQVVTRRIPARTRRQPEQLPFENNRPATSPANKAKYTIKRVNVDINYNERFYMIGPNQMRQEYHSALERGLPYPILTVVEYLSQDDAGFNWSRQYRAAGYYSSIMLWVSVCACILMFCLHCAAAKYGIYMMQILGCLLLFTNLTYYTLVPKGEQKLVIPFEGQSLSFKFGWSFWLTLAGGCIALVVGTVIVIIDYLFPNYIFTTILDVDFDANQNDYLKRKASLNNNNNNNINDNLNKRNMPIKSSTDDRQQISSNGRLFDKPNIPPFYNDSGSKATSSSGTINDDDDDDEGDYEDEDYFDDEDANSTSGASGNIPRQISDNQRQLFERNARVNNKIESTFKQRGSFIGKEPTYNNEADYPLGKQSERAKQNEGSSIVDMGKIDDNVTTNERLKSRTHNDNIPQHTQRSRRTPETEAQTGNRVSSSGDHQNVRL